MSNTTEQTCEHVLELQTGAVGAINFRFPKDWRKRLHIRVAAADSATGKVELMLDNPWRDYEVMKLVEGTDDVPWRPVVPGADGTIRLRLDLNARERFNIESDDHLSHSIRLIGADWHGGIVRLVFREGS